jgi:hypothetical protein
VAVQDLQQEHSSIRPRNIIPAAWVCEETWRAPLQVVRLAWLPRGEACCAA